jgi:hypothetical protein
MQQPPKEERKSITAAIAEAETRELDFDPADRISAVKVMLREIPRLKEDGKTQEQIQETLKEYFEQYPELFKKIYSGEDLAQLEVMLKMMTHIERSELTPYQASVIVGRHLANEYIPADILNDRRPDGKPSRKKAKCD